jgi:hypothetical protein
VEFEAVYKILAYFAGYSVLVPIFFLVYYKNYSNELYFLLAIYLLLCLITEAIHTILSYKRIESTFIANLFSLIEFVLILSIYKKVFCQGKYFKIAYWSLILLLSVNFILVDLQSSMSIFNGFSKFIIIMCALFYFYNENKELSVTHLADHSFFWFNAAFLMYFGFYFFISLFDDFILKAELSVARVLWTVNLINNMIFYALLTVGIWKTSGRSR